ncbi:hypothetical protein GBAR_LOCUS9029, partial [Geodia barretti]
TQRCWSTWSAGHGRDRYRPLDQLPDSWPVSAPPLLPPPLPPPSPSLPPYPHRWRVGYDCSGGGEPSPDAQCVPGSEPS